MNAQPTLFAANVKPSALRVLDALRDIGGTGTAHDCCRRLGQFANPNNSAKRLSELEQAGLVRRIGSRRSPTGRGTCAVWECLP